MTTDEIKAFEIATTAARERGWAWRPRFFIALEDGEWLVHAESESVIRIDQASGALLAASSYLSPVLALARAKEYALANSLNWKPEFSLSVDAEGWAVGSCQSQLAGDKRTLLSVTTERCCVTASISNKRPSLSSNQFEA